MSEVIITGDPVLSVEFIGLPSVNTHYNLHWRQRSPKTGELRYEAREKAYEHTLFLEQGEFLVARALVIINVYPPYEEISDCHNVYIKPLLDGFSDAGVWADDEWAFVPLVLFRWAGIGEQKPRQNKIRRTVIEVYELEALQLRGEYTLLPKGRRRITQNAPLKGTNQKRPSSKSPKKTKGIDGKVRGPQTLLGFDW